MSAPHLSERMAGERRLGLVRVLDAAGRSCHGSRLRHAATGIIVRMAAEVGGANRRRVWTATLPSGETIRDNLGRLVARIEAEAVKS